MWLDPPLGLSHSPPYPGSGAWPTSELTLARELGGGGAAERDAGTRYESTPSPAEAAGAPRAMSGSKDNIRHSLMALTQDWWRGQSTMRWKPGFWKVLPLSPPAAARSPLLISLPRQFQNR